jgi:polysaccharide export outer membrane protein
MFRFTAFILVIAFLYCLAPSGLEAADSAAAPIPPNYRFRPSDLVKVEVFQEPDLSKESRIEADGTILLPLINRIKIADLTAEDAQSLIASRYNEDYLVNPQVSIQVIKHHPRKVDVLGQVNQPGPVEIPFDRELSLLEAISLAKGFTRLSKMSAVQITRTHSDGQKTVEVINADKLMSEASSTAFLLQDGDSVYVPERLL